MRLAWDAAIGVEINERILYDIIKFEGHNLIGYLQLLENNYNLKYSN